MRCSSPTISQRRTTAAAVMSRRKQSNPKPLKPGEDSEWTTNEDVVGDHTSMTCSDVKTEQQQQEPQPSSSSSLSSPPSRPATAELEDPPVVADPPPKLRLNPNLATDPARWSPADDLSPQPPPPPPPLPPPTTSISTAAVALSSSSSTSSSSSSSSSSAAENSPNVVTITTPRAIQIFICNPCGIRFSSLSTLDAHQTYYCSRRHKKDSESDDVKLPPLVIDSDEMVLGNDTDSRPSSVEPSAKSARTGKQYKCPHCSYSADKKVSLNRHMRMHSISPVSIQSPPCASETADPSVVDRYCQNCDIRFSNLRTYQAHKTHYCNTRHVVKPTPSSSPMPSNPSPTNIPTYLALPTNPVIVVPYTLVQNASVLSALSTDIGPPPPTDTACIVLSDGTLQPIAQALVPTKFNMIANNENILIPRGNSQSPPEEFFSPPNKLETINQPTDKRPAVQPSSPLDLRLKRVSVKSFSQHDIGGGGGGTDGEEEKENRRCSDGNITDAEDIVCAPSIPCMILSPSNSPPPTRNKTPQSHHHQHHQRPPNSVQPTGLCNGTVPVQKPQTPPDAENRNGKFSVSSLLHVKQEPAVPSSVAAVISRYGGGHHQAAAAHHKPPGRGASSSLQQPPAAVVVPRGDMLGPATALPYFTSEMTMRLAAAAAAAAAVAATSNPNLAPNDGLQAPAHQFYLKQGPSKCESCNIVFCKYENFLAHKKHYCASRPPPPPPPPQPLQQQQHHQQHGDVDDVMVDKTSPEGSPGSTKPLTVSSPLSSKDSVSPTPVQLKTPMIQFICSTCGVKFSSFDNLTTHQTYYCPNRATTAVAVGGQQDPATLQQLQLDKSLLSKCPKCKMTVEGSLHHHNQHQCQAANCWKCPVCGTVCSSASAAQKHLDNHNGIKAFMCNICQYKGNTLRGLRTHIRMHFNKRLIPDLMEEDYVSCLIDENSAASSTSVVAAVADAGAAKTPTTVDADCKPPVAMAAATVVVLDEDGPTVNESVIVKQEPQQPSNGTVTPGGAAEPHESAAGAYQPLSDKVPAASAQDDDLQSPAAKRGPITAKYCKACDISFNYLSTFVAHKKYYCRNSTEYKACNTENAKTATVT